MPIILHRHIHSQAMTRPPGARPDRPSRPFVPSVPLSPTTFLSQVP